MAKTKQRSARQPAAKTKASPKKRAARKPPEPLELTPAAAAMGEALRRAVWSDPQDRDALRVYADWLMEQGSTRGEYIQLRCLDSPTHEQERAAERLLKKDRGKWLGEARPFVLSWWDSKNPPGFVSHVFCQPAKLVDGFEHIVKLGPRLVVNVISMRPHRRETEAALARLPLGELWGLAFSANDVDEDTLVTLAPAMKGLRWLDLHANDVTARGLAALGANVGTLEYLGLAPIPDYTRAYFGLAPVPAEALASAVDDWARAIFESPGLQSLVHLHFVDVRPSEEWCRRLGRLPHLKKLHTERSPPELSPDIYRP
jgi:uncharacterized protein (TIGR02996 family)